MTNPNDPAERARNYPGDLAEQLEALKSDEVLERFDLSRRRLATDPYRPLYHFSPPENWMNDPNGLCQWQGRYHLFYQFVPAGRQRWHWGHAVSDDLVQWRDLPPALEPDREQHCFSGQTLIEPHRVIAIYHGTESGNSIATAADPLLLNWQPHPANPVIPIVPIDENGAPYRVFDPCIWKEDDGYYSVSGTYKDGVPQVDCRMVNHLFRSADLATWEHLGPLIEDGFFTEPGDDGAVPNFLPVGRGKHMLLFFSHKRGAQYLIGQYDRAAHRFRPERHGRMTYGPMGVGSLHAPSATIDEKGRFVAIFNVKESKQMQDWCDVMSLPRCLSLDGDGRLRIEPAAELESLRCERRSLKSVEIPANAEIPLADIRGKAMEIQAVIELGQAREVGLCVLRSPDGVEQTRISLLPNGDPVLKASLLQIDVSAASLRSDVAARRPEIGPIKLDEGQPLHLRIFIDRSVVEVFANDRQCLTLRAYPQRADSSGVSLFARGGTARLVSLDAWPMRSIWPELKDREGQ